MNQNNDLPIELTDAQLAQIQGGGWLGDAWRAVKKGAKAVYDFIVENPEIWRPKPGPLPGR